MTLTAVPTVTNPLEYISADPAERIGDIDAIGTALYSGGNENDKFWSENAKDLFRGLCLLVLENLELPKTLGEILRQASGKGKPFKQHVQEMLAAGIDNKGQSLFFSLYRCLKPYYQ